MTLIYSNEEVKGLSGGYISPFRFNGVEKGAKLVYTDDVKIADAYSKVKIEVKPITVKEKKVSKTAE